MTVNLKIAQTPAVALYSGLSSAGTSMVTTPYPVDLDGVKLTMADFGSLGYCTVDPKISGYEEIISFTGVTDNGDGTATLTGLSRDLQSKYPYTGSGTGKLHGASAIVVFSNNPQIYGRLAGKDNDETISGAWTFTPVVIAAAVPTLGSHLTNKTYVDGVAVAGAPNASTTVKGIVQEATQAQVLAKTAAGSTGAELYINPATLPSTLLSDYKVDTGSANAYVITPAPAITAYTTGQIFSFKAVAANTTVSTLNVNGLGTKTIKKTSGGDLAANDIIAGQIVVVEYDGTNFQLVSSVGNVTPIQKFGGTGADGALSITSGATNIDLGSAAVVIKNYTSISITGTASLTFTNPHANGTIIILKSQGNVTITSSTAPMIAAQNLGAAGGATVTSTSNNNVVLPGNNGNAAIGALVGPSGGLTCTASVAGLAAWTPTISAAISQFLLKYPWVVPGSGGASGGALWITATTSGTSGIGGRGGGGLIIECAGAWNFTTAGGISVAGANGGTGVGVGSGCTGGGGGGGAGGTFLALYSSLTANSGTVTVTAGVGGNNGTGQGGDIARGGAGGNSTSTGSAGASSASDSAKTGGDGAAGLAVIAANTEYD